MLTDNQRGMLAEIAGYLSIDPSRTGQRYSTELDKIVASQRGVTTEALLYLLERCKQGLELAETDLQGLLRGMPVRGLDETFGTINSVLVDLRRVLPERTAVLENA